ncbi:MAG: thioesterase domain-containing protein, partial [Myxococcales bacterium]|nr:thioesterase domain-containing protein [Myxococcales bacterium]
MPERPKRCSAELRLFCFPHAGGGAAAFRPLSNTERPELDVCALEYPGRWGRHREPAFTQLSPLVKAIADELTLEFERPHAFFGYSFGAVCGFHDHVDTKIGGMRTPRTAGRGREDRVVDTPIASCG